MKPKQTEHIQQLNMSIPVKKTELLCYKRLKELRTRENLNHQQMADRLIGVNGKPLPRMTYISYERPPESDNHRLPPYEVLVQIADIFKVSTDWLLGLTEYPFREGHSIDFDSLQHFATNLTATERKILDALLEKMKK